MKRVTVIYHMKNEEGTAETCVTLPMRDEAADDLLERGASSEHVNPMLMGEVYRILRSLSAIQGYEYEGFCCAELEA